MSPAGWIGRCLLILGMGGVWVSEVSFVPASGKLEFVQEGIVFNPRQQAALVFQFSLGPELRALSEITHLVRKHVLGFGSVKSDRGLPEPDRQTNWEHPERQQSYSGQCSAAPVTGRAAPRLGPRTRIRGTHRVRLSFPSPPLIRSRIRSINDSRVVPNGR